MRNRPPRAAAPNMEYKRCSSCIPGLGALTGYYQPGQLNPAAPNMEYKCCSSCIPGLGALTRYYKPGQLSQGFLASLLLLPLLLFHPGLGPVRAELGVTTIRQQSRSSCRKRKAAKLLGTDFQDSEGILDRNMSDPCQ
ncbi:hypothetical protein LAZ67_3004984 [Cordylochernes scorpioides]|uniref:Uncharacterized protein n=1 Tax=Cordylochernes scorpioides TaxID=51811 RepID=A0ABY6KBQ7_9ARAC|nr:hypothetical protein LAZ67_3004984 [Cordylochernes scorpioides]